MSSRINGVDYAHPALTCFYPRYDNPSNGITLLCDRDARHLGNHAANGHSGRRVYWPHRPGDVAEKATVARVAPNPKRLISDEDDAAIQAALELEAQVDGALKRAVLTAAENGASVRVLAERIGRHASLISRWKRDSRP